MGFDAAVLKDIFANADSQRMPIRLCASRGSSANHVHWRYGFVQTDEAEWDASPPDFPACLSITFTSVMTIPDPPPCIEHKRSAGRLRIRVIRA